MSDTEYETKAKNLSDEIADFLKAHWDQLTMKERFLLSLGRAKLFMKPGQCRSRKEIADDAKVSRQAIEAIENRALRKCLRTSLRILAKEHLDWKPQHAEH